MTDTTETQKRRGRPPKDPNAAPKPAAPVKRTKPDKDFKDASSSKYFLGVEVRMLLDGELQKVLLCNHFAENVQTCVHPDGYFTLCYQKGHEVFNNKKKRGENDTAKRGRKPSKAEIGPTEEGEG